MSQCGPTDDTCVLQSMMLWISPASLTSTFFQAEVAVV